MRLISATSGPLCLEQLGFVELVPMRSAPARTLIERGERLLGTAIGAL